MPLKLVCPNCRSDVRLTEPLPLPGASVQCEKCATPIAVTYPAGVIDQLRARGKAFASDVVVPRAQPPRPPDARFLSGDSMGTRRTARKSPSPSPSPPPAASLPPSEDLAADVAALSTETEVTRVDPTLVADESGPRFEEIDRTVPALRTPYGTLPNNAAEPEGNLATVPLDEALDEDSTAAYTGEDSLEPEDKTPMASGRKTRKKSRAGRVVAGAMGCLGSMGAMGVGSVVLVAVLAVAAVGGVIFYYSKDLPTIETLRAYRPPTVTVVEDRQGRVLGEIFEQRRYVVPIEDIPQHVKDAFLAAEDANFYHHDGIDYLGIVRAMGRNLSQGRMAQGASTITQQVARNFLLTRDKKLERKIKEILLSWRIEDAYDKDHILYLYLNEIFLGSQAYGVEAASRTFYGKGVRDLTLAEAAILAGLPQRPSDYNPHSHWDKARARQGYVLGQMLDKGYITQEQHDQALAEHVKVAPKENKFLDEAPWFTEHVRRHLVERYGDEKVLNDGLRVRTTCDLDLQKLAQKSVTESVFEMDRRTGWRRSAVKNVGKGGLAKAREQHEHAMREAWAEEQDPARRVPVPERSVLEPGRRYTAVVTEVEPKWAKVAIGVHDGLVPLAWSEWVYEPDPRRSWRGRTATDLTALVDSDDDGKRDAPILTAGDVVEVTVESLSSKDAAVEAAFVGTPGEAQALVAVKLWQDPDVESALFAMDLADGAVRAMVGGSDFRESQFNRAVQARRQVGSTFKPIVYAAAIESRRVTSASMFADAPLALATAEEFVWKPSNYDSEYLGNMTLRQALQRSKNTCTVRVLEAADPGMNDDVVYKFARRLGIGGPPTYRLPADWVPTPQNDVLCPWIRETPESTICMDRFPAKDPNVTDRAHRAALGPDDEFWCRACDMSMALGSASLTMEELVRAYSAFATLGELVEPYTIVEVTDRDGKVLEHHTPSGRPRVMEAPVAAIANWLNVGVVRGGTGSLAGVELELQALAGKTGTTNDEKDAWFVGYTNDVIAAVWTGYDQPRTLGASSTGGRLSLPTWIEFMRAAAPKSKDRPFPSVGDLDWANIDETTGRRVTSGGMTYPFLKGTAPESTGLRAGQMSIEDLPQL